MAAGADWSAADALQLADLADAARACEPDEGLAVLADFLAERSDPLGPALLAALGDHELIPQGVTSKPAGADLAIFAYRPLLLPHEDDDPERAAPEAVLALVPPLAGAMELLHGPARWRVRLGAPFLVACAPLDGKRLSELQPYRQKRRTRRPVEPDFAVCEGIARSFGLRLLDDVEWSAALEAGLTRDRGDPEWVAPSVLDPKAGTSLRPEGPALFTARRRWRARVRLAYSPWPAQDHVDLGLDELAEAICRAFTRHFTRYRYPITPATRIDALNASDPGHQPDALFERIEEAMGLLRGIGAVEGSGAISRATVGGWIEELRDLV